MRIVFKELDLDKNGKIDADIFIKVCKDHEIVISEADQNYLKAKVAYLNKVNYEEVIKDLVLLINEKYSELQHTSANTNEIFYWVLRSNNQKLVDGIKNTELAQNYLRLFKFRNNRNAMNQLSKSLMNFNTLQPRQDRHALHHNDSKNENRDSSSNQNNHNHSQNSQHPLHLHLINHSFMANFGPDMQNTIHKIVGSSTIHNATKAYDWSKQISAISKKVNILKNIQNKMYIKQAQGTEQIHSKKEKIRKYMKENDVDIMHLNAIDGAFLDCDEERAGTITKKALLEKIAENNLQFPADFLFNLIQDMQEDSDDSSENAMLKYESLKQIIEIYNNAPIFLKGDSNNSDNFKRNMDTNKDLYDDYQRLDRLLKYVHVRIEEKFKDFRHAFRSFDKNFDGGLNFKEFITGMEGIGKQQHDQLQKEKEKQSQKSTASQKPPRPALSQLSITGQSQKESAAKAHPLFGDGNIPKNKDVNSFQRDIQDITPIRAYMQKRIHSPFDRMGNQTFASFNDAFGISSKRNHDMVALLTNSYSENLHQMTIEELRSSASRKTLTSKNTNAQQLREAAIKSKYKPIPRKSFTPTHGGSAPSITPIRKNIRRRFILEGSNKFLESSAKKNSITAS
ncbi:ef hand family protein [Stylonychia lemnae]|uniref:Ef hand family protein n=1 Tax=Stylonychia lemnae TaxID=5949 RepID=A0A078ALB4_STYLE|nr:ef hand family protein [Stylonychia lemnae]|eukprot:CDW82666.1 ef hand family protein [Stylonychia lemnae]